jgi:hypothetical protein
MENKEIPECRNSSKSQEKQNHRKKMKNEYYPIVVTVPKSNKKKYKETKSIFIAYIYFHLHSWFGAMP